MTDLKSNISIEKNSKKIVFSLGLIIGIGLLARLFYFSQYVPGYSDDAIVYFWYANDIKILDQLPNYLLSHIGWSIFLSFFFEVFSFDNFFDYIELQKMLSVLISVITIIPIYFLCNKFFGKGISLIGALLFAIEPRLIQNSLLGITESFYILLITISFLFILNSNRKLVFLSFGLIGITTIVRFESILLFLPISIYYFINSKSEQNIKRNYLFATIIFLLMLTPLIFLNTTSEEGNFVFNRINAELSYIEGDFIEEQESIPWYYDYNFENIVKFLSWSMIPIFIFFVPLGSILIFKKWKQNNIFIILMVVFTLIPGFYALLRFADSRYLLPAYPMFCIISLFTVKWLSEKIHYKKSLYLILIALIIIPTIVFLETKVQVDTIHETEAIIIAENVIQKTEIINQYSPESKYVMIAKMNQSEFPILSTEFDKMQLLDFHANSIEEYLTVGESMGLTHLVLDGKESIYRHIFFKNIFYNEDEYTYLSKIFDSSDLNFEYHVKIFEIDYDKFHEFGKLRIKD